MCGILTFLSWNDEVSESAFRRGLECLEHRGPDGKGAWISPQRRVALGHTRLSIIDLNTGEQPIANLDGSLRIVANGEFYDFERVRQRLQEWGYRFKTQSDTEIALHLYDQFGPQCLHYLRGEFAFVIWDDRQQLLFAARDRFGIKPLYYTVYQDTLYLASEIKALLAAGIPAVWDQETFLAVNARALHPERTLVSGVQQVPPGHFLIASHGTVKLQRYWDFDYAIAPTAESASQSALESAAPSTSQSASSPPPTLQDYVAQVSATLDDAIRLRLRSDVPIACYLSGGLDSSAILGIANQHASSPLPAFSLAFSHDDYNEIAIAQETAKHLGSELQVLPIQDADLAENFADAIYHCETLCINAGSIAKYLLSRMVRQQGYKVVLTGEGSDEIFGGYATFRQDMLLAHQASNPSIDPGTAQGLLASLKASNQISAGLLPLEDHDNPYIGAIRQQLGFVPTWIAASAAGFERSLPLYDAEFIQRYAEWNPYQQLLQTVDLPQQLHGREPVHQSMYLWSKSILANYIFKTLGDGVEMAHSIEGRVPFLDHELVEIACQIPAAFKIHGIPQNQIRDKYVLREATRPIVTDTIYQRQKHPFLSPPSTLKPDGALHEFLQDTLRGQSLRNLGFYNPSAVVKLLDQIPEMRPDQLAASELLLMRILSSCVLQERFGLSISS